MKTHLARPPAPRSGFALVLTLVLTTIALATLAGALAWSANSARLTDRSIQYNRSVAAAEAATERALGQISRDFLAGGDRLVQDNMDRYRGSIPTSTDSPYWAGWEFNDASGHPGRTFVQLQAANSYAVLNSVYSGLKGFASTYTVVSNARQTDVPQIVVAGVLQEIQLARIPVFQFAMYSSGNMEISCGQPFRITGRVHANRNLYVEPDSALTFLTDVTAVGDILFRRSPDDPRTAPTGTAAYQGQKDARVAALFLPIGTNNSQEAIREIIQPAPWDENPNSPMGRQRYQNMADLVVTVSDTEITGTSGKFNGFSTVIPTNELALFVSAQTNFYDQRETKTVRPVDINVGALKTWSATNSNLRAALQSQDVASIYVLDRRTLPATDLGAVRLVNGRELPSRGLTVATADPLYVQGHYNQSSAANLGTTNTTTTQPASLVGDAITILSVNWSDANSRNPVSSRLATPTTINAALLAGTVETTRDGYGGGMENFPRFLETWGSIAPFTYNGSMVKMFASLHATNRWSGVYYSPPARNWAFDLSFNDAAKLPPLTPSVMRTLRGQWATVPPNRTTPMPQTLAATEVGHAQP